MATQQQPNRPWFRLPSIARPVIDPPSAPAPAPSAPLARPAFRPVNQTQEPIPAGPMPQTATVPRSPPRATGGGATSVPTSPVIRPTATYSSLPTSPAVPTTTPAPAPAPAPTTTTVRITALVPRSPPRVFPPTSSLPTSPIARTTAPAAPSPPKPRVSAPTSSLPPSPAAPKPALSSSVANSPMPKPISTTFSAPTISPKTAPTVIPSATSPIPMAVTTTNTAYATGAARPSPPTTTVKQAAFQTTPPDSPKRKPTAPPPSPLVLPPAKIKPDAEIPLEAEQKRVLVQKTIGSDQNKPKPEKDFGDSHKSGKKETPKDHGQLHEKSRHHKKMNSESESGGMRVITIAGENKGAYMEVIRSPNKKSDHVFEGISHNLHNKNSGSSSYSSSSSEEEGRHKKKMENGHKGKTKSSGFMSTFMNSNVQGVNNSIVYNSSCTHHDPGVHLALSRKPAPGAGHGKDHRSNGN